LLTTALTCAAGVAMLGAQASQGAGSDERQLSQQQEQPRQQSSDAQPTSEPARAAGEVTRAEGGDAQPIEFIGTVVRPTFPTRPFELTLERWSTDAERQRVLAAFKQGENPTAVAEALKGLEPIGSFRTISGLGNEIRYAEQVTAPDGTRKLLLATDRQINYWEGANAPKPVTEAYTFIEVRFDEGEGQGRASHGDHDVVVDPATNKLTIENFDELQPQLLGVTQIEAPAEQNTKQ
jgi:hypothetical protein